MSGVTLVEFLRARLDERETQAQADLADAWAGTMFGLVEWNEVAAGIYNATQARAIADARRVLADVEAKRRIVAICQVSDPHSADEAGNGCTECAVLYTLALPYADHPDYDEGWRP